MKDWMLQSDSEMVCYCQRVNMKTIVDSIKNGNDTLEKIKNGTTACTGGNCKELNPTGMCCSGDILELIRIYSGSEHQSPTGCCSR